MLTFAFVVLLVHPAGAIFDATNVPSFALWTTRGRIFGIPHDIHPVLLAHRADIIEAAGIDVSDIETWEDFDRILRPFMTDTNGYADRVVSRRILPT